MWLLDNLIIGGIAMPRTRSLTVGAEEVANTAKMASGKMVKDITGARIKLHAEWNWLPAETITQIHALLRKGGFFEVEYPDPELGQSVGMFEIGMPTSGVFKFEGGTPRWKDVSLDLSAQEVI